MKQKGLIIFAFLSLAVLLTGCSKSLIVLDPKGPVAKTQSDTILFSMLMMVGVLVVVYILYIFMLTKYRASKADKDYEPPHMEGNKWLEIIWTVIPVIIVVILSVVTVRTTNQVEGKPKGYEDQKPLVIYAASSNWKWHFSYPEEGIETVNYVNFPTNRPIEFRLYSYGPITSFWIPQLGGQKYAMSDMVNKLNLLAEEPGSYMGRNSNFSGEGYAGMEFEALAMPQSEYDKWVKEVKDTASPLTKKEFKSLIKTPHLGRKTYTSTHLSFSPPPNEHSEHMGTDDSKSNSDSSNDTNKHTDMDSNMDMNMDMDH